jgi:hypothetical protein
VNFLVELGWYKSNWFKRIYVPQMTGFVQWQIFDFSPDSNLAKISKKNFLLVL